jgi:hypothetical protein
MTQMVNSVSKSRFARFSLGMNWFGANFEMNLFGGNFGIHWFGGANLLPFLLTNVFCVVVPVIHILYVSSVTDPLCSNITCI